MGIVFTENNLRLSCLLVMGSTTVGIADLLFDWFGFSQTSKSGAKYKNGPSPASFSDLFSSIFKQTLQFLQQIKCENVHPVFCSGIGTHNHWNMSLLP